MFKLLAAALALAVSVPAFASSPAQPQEAPKEKKKCKKIKETGRRLGGQTICMTQEQWDEQSRRNARETTRATQQAGSPR